jgi:predicted enzyme involved in methoxymalonyl-ACP biosynthesis
MTLLLRRYNWQNKAENLKAAAKELNIGTDSFVFIDDNEFELQSVNSCYRRLLPKS